MAQILFQWFFFVVLLTIKTNKHNELQMTEKHQLPLDCILTTLDYCSSETLFSISSVSKDWNHALKVKREQWKSLCYNVFPILTCVTINENAFDWQKLLNEYYVPDKIECSCERTETQKHVDKCKLRFEVPDSSDDESKRIAFLSAFCQISSDLASVTILAPSGRTVTFSTKLEVYWNGRFHTNYIVMTWKYGTFDCKVFETDYWKPLPDEYTNALANILRYLGLKMSFYTFQQFCFQCVQGAYSGHVGYSECVAGLEDALIHEVDKMEN
jgi:hypothetical protein